MGTDGAKLRTLAGGQVGFFCPGCQSMHAIRVAGDRRPIWTYDGNAAAPTFAPSILSTFRDPDGELPDEICHSFVRGGRIEFLSDSTHALAGQTVPLPELPPGYAAE